MALDTFINLKLEIRGWLNRSDLTSVIPSFITLAEAIIAGDVMPQVVVAPITLSARTVALPSAVDGVEGLTITSPVGYGAPMPVSKRQFDREESRFVGQTGTPQYVTVVENRLYLAPTPDQSYTAELTYLERLPPLGNDNVSNSVLREAPGAYLFGSLLQAAPYLKNDARIPVWQAEYEKAVAAVNTRRARRKNPTGTSAKAPVTF